MRKEKRKSPYIRYLIIFLIFVAPFGMGVVGFAQIDGYDCFDAAYAALQLYFVNIAATAPEGEVYGVLIQAARWLAPLVSIMIGISIIIELINGQLWPVFWSKMPGVYVVYGDADKIRLLCPEAGKLFCRYCVVENGRYVGCRQYLLLFHSDEDNLGYYSDVLMPRLSKKQKVYMNVVDLERQDIQDTNLVTFQLNEYIADQFFMEPDWIKDMHESAGKGRTYKIAIIGFEELGIKMLETALELNLVSTKQHVEYNIWGNTEKYEAMNRWMLGDSLLPDSLAFRGEGWYNNIEMIAGMDSVILCGSQNENIHILSDLLRLTNISGQSGRVYVYTENAKILELFQVRHFAVSSKRDKDRPFTVGERLRSFSTPADRNFLESILKNRNTVSKKAQLKHEDYLKKEWEKDQENQYFEWTDLNAFLRWDNEMSVKFDAVRDYLEGKLEIHEEPEELAELEHIRWLRSHYIYGWVHEEVRNDAMKKHPVMKAFKELSEEERIKNSNKL